MAAHETFDPSLGAMSNYSVYFLRQNAHLDINCSVYSLTLGLLKYQDYTTGTWLGNILNFVPAYYVTNCLVTDLWAQIASQNVSMTDIEAWLDEYRRNPYNVADNGDSFVALLFMLVGLCVSCWMLLLLFLLLPKHKQKPVLTQIAMLFYLIYLTIIFSRVAQVTEAEYYADLLDMIRILSSIADKRFAVLYLILNLLTHMAYLQLFLKMTKKQWKLLNCSGVSLIIVGTLITGALYVPLIHDSMDFVTLVTSIIPLFSLSLQTLFMLWFAVCLAHYTLFETATPPKQVSYSKKLIPLAILTWVFIIIHIVQTLLLATLWRDNWLTKTWVSFVPALLEMYILTASWEWFYSIRHLELRLEIVDMLGRRISLEDVMDFNNDEKVKRTAFRGRFESFLGFFRGQWGTSKTGHKLDAVLSTTTASSSTAPVVVDCGLNNETQNITRDDESSEYEVHYMDTDSWEDGHGIHDNQVPTVSGNPVQHEHSNNRNHRVSDHSSSTENGTHTHNFVGHHTSGSIVPDIVEGTSRGVQSGDIHEEDGNIEEELPPFRPHPGFSKDDYWDEK